MSDAGSLAAHQTKMLGLIRSTYEVADDDDAYIRRVADSRDLAEARRNIFMWRVFVLERTCVLTFALLGRKRLLEDELNRFISEHNISPFRETQAPAFLQLCSQHPDTLVASVAQFEAALQRVRLGDSATYVVRWTHDPALVLNALAKDLPLDETVCVGCYETVISHTVPGGFRIYALP